MSLALFAAFGVGAALISPLVLVLRRPALCQRVVRAAWIPLVWLFRATRLIRVDASRLAVPQGSAIAANHPSLINVVLFVALVPKTLYVAKRALRGNPFMAAIVRMTSLPDDERLVEEASGYLAKGWNVLVFPEGTRTPSGVALGPLKRGAAHLALRTGAPLVAVGVSLSPIRILGKSQHAWTMGASPVTYTFRADAPTRETPQTGEPPRAAARRVTAALASRLSALTAH